MSELNTQSELNTEAVEPVESTVPTSSTDDEMEEPRTKDYSENVPENGEGARVEVKITFKPEFKDALLQTIGTLGYDSILGTPEVNIRVNQLFDALNSLWGQDLTETQANQFISFVAKAPYNVISEVMSNIQTNPGLYFDVKQ